MPPKTVVFVAASCLTAGWIVASVLTPPVARVQVLHERRAAQSRPPVESFETAYSEHLRWRLQQAPAPPTPRRNPFVFGDRPRSDVRSETSERRESEPRNDAPLTVAAPVPVGPVYALAGMATSQSAQGPVRTAVLSDGHGVHLVKLGDAIGGYTVTAITETTVTLEDRAGTQYVLRLTQ